MNHRTLASAAALLLLPWPSMLSAATPISAVPTAQAVVALTFDDGPHASNTARMLEVFARENIRVTFFEIGDHVAQFPELARAVVTAGHEIGNHTKSHANLAQLGEPDAVRAEIVDAQRLIQATTGVAPVVFRAPFLAHGPAVWTVLDELKLPSITSEVVTRDWDKSISTEEIIERASRAGPGDIVLLHTWPDQTVEALPEIIRRLREKGLRFVTVSELLALASTPAGSSTPE